MSSSQTSHPLPRFASATAERDAWRRLFIAAVAGVEPARPSDAGRDDSARRPCAHAEAAALRWYEQHDCDAD